MIVLNKVDYANKKQDIDEGNAIEMLINNSDNRYHSCRNKLWEYNVRHDE